MKVMGSHGGYYLTRGRFFEMIFRALEPSVGENIWSVSPALNTLTVEIVKVKNRVPSSKMAIVMLSN